MKENKCIDCGIIINHRSKRCYSCEAKRKWKEGDFNSHFKYLNILTKSFLEQEYIKNKKSTHQIAKDLSIHNSVIYNWLKKFNIAIRPRLETIRKGKLHHWFGKYHSPNKGHKATKETRLKMSEAMKGKNNPFYGRHHTKESIIKMRKKQIETYLKAPFKRDKINKSEKRLNKILNKLFPKEYKFVGNSKIWIGNFNPDFINCNGQKKIIEFYGDYWHNLPNYKKRDKRRLKEYSRLGYSTLVIWEHELKIENKENLINRLKYFHNLKLK